MPWDPGGLGEAKAHLGLREVPDFLPPGGAQPAQAWGLLNAVVQGGGAGGAVAHCLQVLAGDGLEGAWKTRQLWVSTHCLATCLQPLLRAALDSAQVQAGGRGRVQGPCLPSNWEDGEHARTHLGRQ